jgi:signal peptidase I
MRTSTSEEPRRSAETHASKLSDGPQDTDRRARKRSPIIIAVAVAALILALTFIRTYVAAYYSVNEKTRIVGLEAGDVVLINRFHYSFHHFARGEVVCVRAHDGGTVLRRVLGLPGETIGIRKGRLLVNGAVLEGPWGKRPGIRAFGPHYLYPGHVFALSDGVGPQDEKPKGGDLHVSAVVGRPILIIWPPHRKKQL